MATKTSILVFYLKLSGASQQFFRWASIITLIVVNIAGCALTVLNIVRCNPLGAVFNYPLPDTAKCMNILQLSFSSAPINIITDLAILFLPMPILTGLRLPRKQKVGLIAVFGRLFIWWKDLRSSDIRFRTWCFCHFGWCLEDSVPPAGVTTCAYLGKPRRKRFCGFGRSGLRM